MRVKVDFAPENKEKDIYKIGTYAIYVKKHWYSRWRVVGTSRYADIKNAVYDAKQLPPIYVQQKK